MLRQIAMDMDAYSNDWEEFILTLPNHKFIDLIKLHLGEMPSPFNKQKLIEQLKAFLKKPSTKEEIIRTLDKEDILVLAALEQTGGIPCSLLNLLFINIFSYSEIQNKIANMEDRLLIYKRLDIDENTYYDIPLFFKEALTPLLDKDLFFLPEKNNRTESKEIYINNIFVAGLFSFLYQNDDIFKKEGTLKKKPYNDIINIFPILKNNLNILEYIFISLENLGLITKTENSFIVNEKKWELFSDLTNTEKYIYILSNSIEKIKKEWLAEISICLTKFFNLLSIHTLYNKNDLEILFFMVLLKSSISNSEKFEIMQVMTNKKEKLSFIDIAIEFNILCKDSDSLIYINPILFDPQQKETKAVLIDPSYEITILPSADLKDLLKIATFIKPVLIQTTGKFKLTQKTCIKIFEQEFYPKTLCEKLQAVSVNKIPESIILSITEWHKKITSIFLYHGFIIQITKEKEKFFEYNDDLKKIIRKKLAPGIYLLNIKTLSEFKKTINSNNLNFIFLNTQKEKPRLNKKFNHLNINLKENNPTNKKKLTWLKDQYKRQAEYEKYINNLKKKLKEKKISKHLYDYLITSIDNKIIFSENQLNNSLNIKIKTDKASSLDFLGKIRLSETAISNNDFVAIEIYTNNKIKEIIGTPIELIKNENSAMLTIKLKSTAETIKISIAQIYKLSIIKSYIFS